MYPGTFARSAPNRPAIVWASTGEIVTFAELDDRSLRLANHLRAQGFERGDVIAMVCGNDPRVFDIYWAAQRAGIYVTAVNFHLTLDEVRYILDDSGAEALFLSAELQHLAEPLTQMPRLRVHVSVGGTLDGYEDLDELISAASHVRPDEEPRGGDMLYSSGTTGRPKGVKPALPDRRVDEPGDSLVAVFGTNYGFDEQTIYLSPAPLYHAAPLRTCAVVQACGGTVVVMDRFDAELALDAIERYAVSHSQWVPTMFVRMLKLPAEVRERYDISSMQVAVHAAAPCPVEVKQAMMDWWGPVLHEYYAATEVNGITMVRPEEWLRKPGTVGTAVLGVLRICDEMGEVLPPGKIGTIYFERDELPFRYHGDPALTEAAQHPAHPTWTTVGDLGYVDEDGALFLTDRKAFMIISGGVNIYPREVEDVLTMHPAVADIAVIGVPDEEMGEQVKAVIQLAAGTEADDALRESLIAHVRERLAGYKVPRSLDFVDQLPRTPTGKLVKSELVRRYRPTGTGS